MIELENAVVYHGSNLDVLPTLPDNSVDAIVTDPPYELGFMGKKWDSSGIAYNVQLWQECLRVLKPGGHLLAFGGTRTFHRMAVAIEDAGFEVRDMIAWISNKTFPKSHNIGKATGKEEWQGWGTALKPTVEPVVMARKPFAGTIADNVLLWGVGGLNIDGSRIGTEERTNAGMSSLGVMHDDNWQPKEVSSTVTGRWPANIILDEYTAGLLDEQSGVSKSPKPYRAEGYKDSSMFGVGGVNHDKEYGDSGGASRFFYVAKASKKDRNEGLDGLPDIRHRRYGDRNAGSKPNQTAQAEVVGKNFHPTVKPTALMEYLIKLVTPAGGTVLDPFTGSGSTGKAALLNGYKFIGCELTAEYLPIIEGRLRHAAEQYALKATVEETKEQETLF